MIDLARLKAAITYRDLQKALGDVRNQGVKLLVSLNENWPELKKERNRLLGLEIVDPSVFDDLKAASSYAELQVALKKAKGEGIVLLASLNQRKEDLEAERDRIIFMAQSDKDFFPRLDPERPWGTSDGAIACRPIFSRLPHDSQGYRSDETEAASQDPSNWITDFYDELLCSLKYSLENYYRDYLDCKTAKEGVLDWLAQLHGFAGEYWDPAWDPAFKREMLCRASDIWQGKGTEELFNWLLSAYGVNTCTDPKKIWRCKDFIAGETRLNWPIKGDHLESFVRLPRGTHSDIWKAIRLWIEQYMPAWAIIVVCYCYFYAGESRAGDGVFDRVLEKCQGLVPSGINEVEAFYLANQTLAQDDPLEYFARLLQHLANFLGLPGQVLRLEPFRAGVTRIPAPVFDPDDLAGNPGIFLRVDPADDLYKDYLQTWRDRERLVQLYRPYREQWEVSVVCQDYFYAGLSAPSHPVFDPIYLETIDAAIAYYKANSTLAASDPLGYFAGLLQALLAVLGIAATVANAATLPYFFAGIASLPAPTYSFSNLVRIEFSNSAPLSEISKARRLVELYRPFAWLDPMLLVGYDRFYAGLSTTPYPTAP